MEMQSERQLIMDLGCHAFDDSEPGTVRERRRVGKPIPEQSHKCDRCGVIAPDVELWAENSETGEEIWLCMACGGW